MNMCSDLDEKTLHIFTWTIENFRAITQQNRYSLDSPAFMAESLDKTSWYVKLYPRGNQQSTKEFISCFLYRSNHSAGPEEVDCLYTIEAIDSNNQSIAKHEDFYKFKKGGPSGEKQFIKRDPNLSIYSENDVFTIVVRMKTRLPQLLTKNSCFTRIVTDQFSFKFKAENSISSDAVIETVSFSETTIFEIATEIPEDEVKISLRRIKGFDETQILICNVALLDLKGNETDSKEAIFEANKPEGLWKFPALLKKSKIDEEKDKYLEKNYFTLKFDFALSNGKTIDFLKNIERKHLGKISKVKEHSLQMDLKRVFTNQDHSDVELHVDKKVIPAHKVILCARSPVFAAMFSQNMAEKQSNIINISDLEAETLNSLLEFMYTGETETLDCEMALKLLLAADKYQVSALKDECSSTLESLVSDENVCDILYTADLIHQESLKVCAVNHVKEHSKKIFKSDEWKQLADKNLKLATETFCEVSIWS